MKTYLLEIFIEEGKTLSHEKAEQLSFQEVQLVIACLEEVKLGLLQQLIQQREVIDRKNAKE